MSDPLGDLIDGAEQSWTDPAGDLALNCACPECGRRYSGHDSSGGHCRGGAYGGCCYSFRSNTTASAHRVGPGTARRCLTPDEMRAKGWTCDDNGTWRAAPPPERPWSG